MLLINPPFYRFQNSHNNDSRLGLGYISATLRKAGIEVYQYNGDYEPTDKFAKQTDLYKASESFIDEIRKPHHPIYAEIYELIDKEKPDVVGMTVMAGTVIQAEMIAKYCSDHNIRVIVGGPMITLALWEFVKHDYFHQLIPGEAEKVIVQAINHPERRIVVGSPTNNINTLPFPDRDNFLNDDSNMTHGSILSARGCPFNCKYCAHAIMGGEIRFRSAKNVADELEYIIDNFGQRTFRFFDDTFTLNKKRVYDLCSEIKFRRLDIEFLIETRVDCLDPKIIVALKEVGLKTAKLGIESGSKKILKIYKPQYNKDDIRKVIKSLRDNDIGITLNWMFGFPEETNADLEESIAFAKELNGDWNTISSLAPYYGTDLFDELPEEKKIGWKGWYHTMKTPIMNDGLDPKLIDEFLAVNE